MSERVLSIEMGYSLTKVCEVEVNPGKAPKIFNSFVIVTPEGVLRDGVVEINDEFVNQFLRMLSVKRIKTRKAIFTISSSKIATREAVIPYVKESKIKDLVRANLGEYFPIDPSQYMFAHSILAIQREEVKKIEDKEEAKPQVEEKVEEDDTPKDGLDALLSAEESAKKGKKKKVKKAPEGKPTGYKLLLLAAPKQLIRSYERIAKEMCVDIVSIDYNGNSIYQAAKEECGEGVQLIIKVDERSSLLMVMEDGVTSLNRTIPYGIDEAINTLKKCTELGDTSTYEKAVEVARRKTVIFGSLDETPVVNGTDSTSEEAIKAEKKEVTESLRPLVGGVLRVIDYYNANHGQRPIEKIFLTGIGADFSGLSALMTREAGLKIKNLTHLAGIDIEKIFKDVSYGEYITAIGATIAPIDFYPDHDDETTRGANKGVDTTVVAIAIAGACLVGAVAMAIFTLVPYFAEKKAKAGYERTIAELQPAYDIYLQYQALDKQLIILRDLDNATNNRNNDLRELLANLESKMPSTFILDSLTASSESVVMSASVESKSDVAYVLSELKKFDAFISADLTAVTERTSELGEKSYAFTAEMIYAPIQTEAEVEEVQE